MYSFRMGNDLHIRWSIERNGIAEDFSGKTVSVRLLNPFGRATRINYTIEGNVVNILFSGMHQILVGYYNLLIIENEDEPNMYTLDRPNAFKLVPHSCEACDRKTLDITSDFCVPANGLSAYEIAKANGYVGSEKEWLLSLKGAEGKSAYELWLSKGNSGTMQDYLDSLKGEKGDNGKSAYEVWLTEGNQGSVDDYLASIKGEKGDPGKDGNLIYPTYVVDTEMHLKVNSDVDTKRLILSNNGHMTINV